ncbi:MAG: hypothetical protein ACHQ51_11105 [Elusimicrobiota bacterium]
MAVGAAPTVPRRRLLIAASALAVLALGSVSVLDPDLPWHLSAARHLLETGAFPHQDFLSWTMAGRPWVDFEWGSELVFAGLLRLGGSPALWIFRSVALCGVIAAFVELLCLWKIPEEWRFSAAPLLTAALVPLFGLRPEIFSLLFFMLELHLLERRRLGARGPGDGAFLALHLGLYAVWANLHAGFAAGLLLCLCYGAGEAFVRRGRRIPVPLLAGAAGFLGTFANPYGAGLYAVLSEHWRQIETLRRLIEEWKAPSLLLHYLTGYWLLFAFSFTGLLLALREGEELPPEHAFVAVAFVFFGARSIRTTKYLMLLLYPMGLSAWATFVIRPARRRALALAAALAVPCVAWRGFTWAGSLRVIGWPAPMEAQGPARAIAFLRAEKTALSSLNLYNPYNWGGSLGYALSPDYKVFIDGRYIFLDLLDEVDRAQRSPGAFRALIDGRDIGLAIQQNDGLMLRDAEDPLAASARPYAAYAWPRSVWALVYWDSQALIYVRRAVVSREWLAKNEYRWLRPHDLRQLGFYVVAGMTPLAEVETEVARYRREIGDPRETGLLDAWLSEFERGLPARAVRR